MTPRAAALCLAEAAASGVLGWCVLMAAFEGAYWGGAWLRMMKRKREGSC